MVKGIGVAAAASVLLLAGCAAVAPLPAPLSDADVQQIRDVQNAEWWLSMFPAEPIPEIVPVAQVDAADLANTLARCVLEAALTGVVPDDGVRGYRLIAGYDTAELNRVLYRCAVQYPTELGNPSEAGYFSTAQLGWLHDFYVNRLVPCLRLAGYQVGSIPPRDAFEAYGDWSPYFSMSPTPTSAGQWRRVDRRCPPPPFGSFYRPGENLVAP